MFGYTEAFCPKCHYRCLMPIEYELSEDGEYHKIKCACADGTCEDKTSCEHFQNAPEVEEKWRLVERKLGE